MVNKYEYLNSFIDSLMEHVMFPSGSMGFTDKLNNNSLYNMIRYGDELLSFGLVGPESPMYETLMAYFSDEEPNDIKWMITDIEDSPDVFPDLFTILGYVSELFDVEFDPTKPVNFGLRSNDDLPN